MTYLEQFEATRGERDPKELQARFDAARDSLKRVLSELFHPASPTQKEEISGLDREGDTEMKDGETAKDGEVVTIPITVEDELADIPPEMRENVAKEIAAFRDRSNRRDIERLRREEEIESMERARNSGSRISRLGSPPASAPSGPAGGANGIPLGPRGDRNVPNAPSGPKGFGVQIPKDYQRGVSFVNGGAINGSQVYIDREDEDSDASDEELERRRQAKRDAEQEKQFLDQERRWLNRERSRTAALEREKKRDKEEDGKLQAAHDEMEKRLMDWDDNVEASRKANEYYADRGAWLRSRAVFRSREISMDDADRAAEERELAQSAKQQEQARGMADDFLARQAQELEARAQAPAPQEEEPQRFKLSLGAAAQKAQAATGRRTVAEVEGLLEDEEEPAGTTRRQLIPIKFDSAAEAAGLSDEERAQAARQLAAEIPTDKDGLWKWDIKWEFVDEAVISDQIKPFVEKKIVEYLGVQEQMLVDVVEEHVRKHGSPQELVEQLEMVSDIILVCCVYLTSLTCVSTGIGRGSRSAGSQALAYAHLLLGEREAWPVGIRTRCYRLPIRDRIIYFYIGSEKEPQRIISTGEYRIHISTIQWTLSSYFPNYLPRNELYRYSSQGQRVSRQYLLSQSTLTVADKVTRPHPQKRGATPIYAIDLLLVEIPISPFPVNTHQSDCITPQEEEGRGENCGRRGGSQALNGCLYTGPMSQFFLFFRCNSLVAFFSPSPIYPSVPSLSQVQVLLRA
jgi:hypothetical protein